MQVTASSQYVAVTVPGGTNAPVTGRFDPDTAADVFIGPQKMAALPPAGPDISTTSSLP